MTTALALCARSAWVASSRARTFHRNFGFVDDVTVERLRCLTRTAPVPIARMAFDALASINGVPTIAASSPCDTEPAA